MTAARTERETAPDTAPDAAPDAGTATGSSGTGVAGDEQAAAAERRRRTTALRRRLVGQLLFELVLPLGSYYVLRGIGAGQWLSMIVGSVLLLPWIGWGLVRQRRLETMAVFTLSIVVAGTLISLLTGSPRVLMIRDSWLTGAIAVWVLGTLLTRRPFMMTASRGIVIAKIGEEGLAAWEARWDVEPLFRHHLRFITAVWGAGFLLDALARITLAYTVPVDAFPLISTLLWLAILGSLIVFHNVYITRNGLKL